MWVCGQGSLLTPDTLSFVNTNAADCGQRLCIIVFLCSLLILNTVYFGPIISCLPAQPYPVSSKKETMKILRPDEFGAWSDRMEPFSSASGGGGGGVGPQGSLKTEAD